MSDPNKTQGELLDQIEELLIRLNPPGDGMADALLAQEAIDEAERLLTKHGRKPCFMARNRL